MKKIKIIKLLSAILALTVIASVMTACSKSVTDGAYSTEEELRVVGTIGEHEVLYDEYRYVVLSCRDIMEVKYGEGIWETDESAAKYSDELNKMVMERITANYAVISLCEEYGYNKALTDKETVKKVNADIDDLLYQHALNQGIDVTVKEGLDGTLNYIYESGGLNKAYELLREELYYFYLTERVMRLTLGVEYAFEVLVSILTAKEDKVIYRDDDIEEYMFSDQFICTRHVFIENDPEESIEANRDIADMLLREYREGKKSMDQLIGGRYNDDVSTPYEGSYFTRGEMEIAYENAAFALKEGEVSEVIEGENGFYIIERCKKSTEYMMSNFETYATQITYSIINTMVRERQKELSLELNEYGRSLVLYRIPTTRGEKNEQN